MTFALSVDGCVVVSIWHIPRKRTHLVTFDHCQLCRSESGTRLLVWRSRVLQISAITETGGKRQTQLASWQQYWSVHNDLSFSHIPCHRLCQTTMTEHMQGSLRTVRRFNWWLIISCCVPDSWKLWINMSTVSADGSRFGCKLRRRMRNMHLEESDKWEISDGSAWNDVIFSLEWLKMLGFSENQQLAGRQLEQGYREDNGQR